MGKRNQPRRGVRKQRIWLVILSSLLLIFALITAVCAGVSLYAVNMLQGRLDAVSVLMDDYADVIDSCLAEGKTRAAQYAAILSQSCFAETSSGNLDDMLAAFGALEPGSDIGVVDPSGNVTSTLHTISAPLTEAFYTETLLSGGGVYPRVEGEARGVVFTAHIRSPQGDGGVLYIVDADGLNVSRAVRSALTEASVFCIVDDENRMISYVGERPVDFDYDQIEESGLLFSEMRRLSFFELLRGGGAGLNLSLTGLEALSGDKNQLPAQVWETIRNSHLTTGAWFDNDLSLNQWRVVAFSRQRLDAFSMRELLAILAIAALVIIVPIFASVGRTVSTIVNNRRVMRALLYDPVTGGNNFQYFKQAALKLMKSGRYNGKVFSFVSLDVNRFRVFSDVHGHEEGEALLFQIFRLLQKNLRRGELLARYTVDEFALLLILDPKEDALARVDALTRGIGRLYPGDKITCSVGIYIVGDRTLPVERMYGFATVAKDAAHAALSDAPVLFDNSMRSALLREQQIESLMEKALKGREFVVYLQPKYSVRTQRLAGAEALVRWVSPEMGFVSPGDFIPLFERDGFILRLDDYILHEVCRIQRDFLDKGRALVPVSVNISRAHFADRALAQHIASIVDEHGVPHTAIELEMTESAFFDDKLVLLNTVNQLHKLGFAVSMDDFGSGYSSLNSLKDLPLDTVKLDKAFFDAASDVDRGVSLIRDTIQMAKNLDMQVVAEGIETREQVEFLAETGCDLIQGFFFAKPMPVADFERL